MGTIAMVFGKLLKFIFDITHHYGISIILFTVIVKLAMYPLTQKQAKSMKEMQDVQPKVKAIQDKYKNNKQLMEQKVMELYKEHKINPASGCLILLVQMPILFGLFQALRSPGKYVFSSEAVYKATHMGFLWIKDLSVPDVYTVAGFAIPFILPLIAGITTYISSAMMSAKSEKSSSSAKDPMQMNQKILLYLMPVMIYWWGRSFPAGLTLYWAVSNIFQIAQQYIVMKQPSK